MSVCVELNMRIRLCLLSDKLSTGMYEYLIEGYGLEGCDVTLASEPNERRKAFHGK